MNINIDDYFNLRKLEEIYNQKLIYSTSNGSSSINNNYFRKNRAKIFERICKSIHEKKFKFDIYKIILIPKDVNVPPRKICIATMKDRVVLETLKEIIYDIYQGTCLNAKIGLTIEQFISTYKSGEYEEYIYADVSKFYDSISHTKLLNKIKKVTKDKWFLDLLKMSIKNSQRYKKTFSNKKGVPQGLSISNVLANIYLLDFDTKFQNRSNIKYLRYVDDIFIFNKKNASTKNFDMIIKQLNNLGLNINKEKSKPNSFNNDDPIPFLGYRILKDKVSVRDATLKKLENNLEKIFKAYHYSPDKNKSRLEWIINLRITGAIIDDKKYGWLYYFSRINDLKLLYHLDYLIEKFKKRYHLDDIKTKSFVKTYWEIVSGDPRNSSYLLNVNLFGKEQKQDVLTKITNFNEAEIKKFSAEQLDFLFKKYMFKDLKALEMDLDGLS